MLFLLCLGLGGSLRRCGSDSLIHPFENGFLSRVAGALFEFDDAGVATGTSLERRRDVFEQNADHVLLRAPFLLLTLAEFNRRAMRMQLCHGLPARVKRAFLAERDDLLGHGTR